MLLQRQCVVDIKKCSHEIDFVRSSKSLMVTIFFLSLYLFIRGQHNRYRYNLLPLFSDKEEKKKW